jgi:hypothetical protein
MGLRPEFCQLVGKSAEAVAALRQADAELHTALIDIERVLPLGVGPALSVQSCSDIPTTGNFI